MVIGRNQASHLGHPIYQIQEISCQILERKFCKIPRPPSSLFIKQPLICLNRYINNRLMFPGPQEKGAEKTMMFPVLEGSLTAHEYYKKATFSCGNPSPFILSLSTQSLLV